jgi:hypothetical protein
MTRKDLPNEAPLRRFVGIPVFEEHLREELWSYVKRLKSWIPMPMRGI